MSEKIYFHILFFCGILCQAIFATLADKDTNLSSDFLVRKRRVINRLEGGRSMPAIETVNYIVKIKDANRGVCAGAILSHYTVITAAPCIYKPLTKYTVLSGATYEFFNQHEVTSKEIHHGFPPQEHLDSIALITVDPPFVYTPRTGPIQLYVGPLHVGVLVKVYGWGFFHPIERGTERRQRLRSITLPIMNHGECQNAYEEGHYIHITQKHVCTYHAQQCCANNDEGAPLVVNQRLAGIHVFKGESRDHRNPDVFINLQSDDYSRWIREHALLM